MKYLGFDRPSFGFKTIGWTHKGPKLSADFTTQTYKKNGKSVSFAEAFEFYRSGKAWLITDEGLIEFLDDEPRFDGGLLIEEEATNHCNNTVVETNVKIHKVDKKYLRKYERLKTGYICFNDTDVNLTDDILFTVYTDLDHDTADVYMHTKDSYKDRQVENKRIIAKSAYIDNDDVRVRPHIKGGTIGQFYYMPQIEFGDHATSYILTDNAPVTRHADYLYTQTDGTTLTGDWDDTLNLWLEDGELLHTGYGKIRHLEIN